MVNVCWPGLSPARLNGVTHAELFCPSIWIWAPAGVEVTLNCPGTIAGATGRGLAFFLLLLYLGCTETACGAAVTGSAVTCSGDCAGVCAAGWLEFGWAAALAAGCAGVTSSSAFSEWMCHAIAATISKIIAMAPAIETMKSFGGVFLISATAFFATSRGCTLGFSGGALLNTAACTALSGAGSSAGGGGGGGMCTSFSGGNSSISEKLRLAPAPADRFSAIMGSTWIFGASTSGSITTDDMVAAGVANDSTVNVSTEASEALVAGVP